MRSENSAARFEFVRHDDHRVPVLVSQPPQPPQQFHFAADIEVLRGLIEQQQGRLLRQRPRQNHALLLTAGKLIHPAVAQRIGADLRQRISGEQAIFLRFKAQTAAVRIAALQHVFPHAQRKQQFAFLLHQRDALRARSQIELADFRSANLDAPREWLFESREQPQQR